jgi:hypothetical protein
MARAIMGGLLFGAVTSLFVVPAFYVWLDNGIQATRRFLAKSRTAQAGKVAPLPAGNEATVRKSAGPRQAAGDFFQ